MKSAARKIEPAEIIHELGRVLPSVSGGLFVRAARGDVEAKRAASCLIVPAVGDSVLLVSTERGAFVTAVLEREPGAKSTIALDGDLELRLEKGRFAVAAQEGVDLVSGKDVSVVASGLRVNAVEGNVVLQRLSFLGGAVRAELEKLKLVASTFDATLERLSQKVKRSYRSVEELDQVRAGSIDYTAKSVMSLHAENALVTAEELVKVDGEQIHLG